MMMTDCFSPACSGSKALPSLTFCGMMTSQSVSNSMGVVGSTLYSKGTHNMILDWWLGRWNVQ